MPVGSTGNLVAGLVAGLAIGAIHLVWLRHEVMRLSARRNAGRALLAGAFLRLAVMLAGFALIARTAGYPGLALIAALVGFTLARSLGLRYARRSES